MEPLINYRLLSDRLTQTEFITFLQLSITKLNARELFTKLLYDKFKQSPNFTQSFTNIIANIIRDRELPDSSSSPSPTSITQLPSSLISACGAYLEMEEYFAFSQSCCKIYLSLHQQPMLTKCAVTPTSKIAKCPRSFPLSIFRNSKQLTIDTGYFYNNNLSFNNQVIWQKNENLHKVELRNSSKIGTFLRRDSIKKTNIETLSLCNIDYPHSATYKSDAKGFAGAPTLFPNLKSLKLSKITFNSVATAANPFTTPKIQYIKAKCPNITALEIGPGINDKYYSQLYIDAIGDQLQALNIAKSDVDLSKIEWGNLEELIIQTPTKALLNGIFASAVNLKRAMIVVKDWDSYKVWEENMLNSQDALELMFIRYVEELPQRQCWIKSRHLYIDLKIVGEQARNLLLKFV